MGYSPRGRTESDTTEGLTLSQYVSAQGEGGNLGLPGGPAVKTLHFPCRDLEFHPWSETKIPQDLPSRHKQINKQIF